MAEVMVNKFKAKAMALVEGTAVPSRTDVKDDSQGIESYEEVFIKMIKEIAKFYSNDIDEGKSQTKKLKLTPGLWLAMSQKTLFKKHSSAAHMLSKKLKEKRIVARSSVLYPKNIKFLSANPLANCFVHSDFSLYDSVLEYRDELIYSLQSQEIYSEAFVLSVWVYLRIFHLDQIPKRYFKYLCKENYYALDGKRLFIFPIEKVEEYQPIETYTLDEHMSAAFDRIYGDGVITKIDCLFSEKLEEYDIEMQKTLHKKFSEVSFSQMRKLVQLEYQLHHTPLSLTLMLSKKHPKISVLEIKKMYPAFDAPRLIEIERNNIATYRKLDISIDDLDEEETPLQKQLFENLEIYDYLKRIVNVPLGAKEFTKYLKEWKAFIDKHVEKEEGFLLKILEFSRILLYKADPSISSKPIKPKTLKEYLRISFQYAFKYIVAEGDINEEVIKSIEEGIIYNDSLTLVTQRKYKRIINVFLKNMTDFKSLRHIESVIHIRRSVVFKDELDELIDRLIEKDKGDIQKLTDKNFVITYKNAVFSILLYYSGCRKNELRSRLVKDIVAIPQKDFLIDINKKGINKLKKVEGDKDQSLKSFSANKRRVRFTVSDKRHLDIIKRYLSITEKNGYRFLFPQHNRKTQKIYKYKVISEGSLNHISEILQEITQRYTPLHSLRHSYATNQLKYIYESNQYRVEDIFEISNQIGHNDPSVTMNYYMHIDLLRLTNILI